MLTNVTAVRSASEILESADDLEPERRRRFHAILSTESARLSDVAQALAAFFGKPQAGTRSISVSDEVDDVIIERDNHFPGLEDAAATLAAEVGRHGGILLAALPAYLEIGRAHV